MARKCLLGVYSSTLNQPPMNAKHPEWNPDSTEELRDMIGKGEEDKKAKQAYKGGGRTKGVVGGKTKERKVTLITMTRNKTPFPLFPTYLLVTHTRIHA